MKWFLCVALSLQLIYVLSAPAPVPDPGVESHDVEEELINHLHATVDDKPHNANDARDSKSSEESLDEESWYDITVGDVIFDVLLTLRQHPEIVKELITSEKEKLAEQIDTYNTFRDTVGNPAEFQDTAEQLNSVPKSVEKKTGHSGMPVYSAAMAGLENKRADELTNDALKSEDSDADDTQESDEWPGVMEDIKEGGQDDPMFNYEKVNKDMKYSNEQDDTYGNKFPGADFTQFRYPYNMVFPALNPGSTGVLPDDDHVSASDDSKSAHADNASTGAADDKTGENDSEELHEHPLPPGPVRPYQDEDIVKM